MNIVLISCNCYYGYSETFHVAVKENHAISKNIHVHVVLKFNTCI